MKKSVCFILCTIMLFLSFPLATSATTNSNYELIRITYNGVPVVFQQRHYAPVSDRGWGAVGVRDLYTALGFSLAWNSSTHTATLSRDDFIITKTVGERGAIVTNRATNQVSDLSGNIEVAIQNGVLVANACIPLAYIGYFIRFDNETRILSITSELPRIHRPGFEHREAVRYPHHIDLTLDEFGPAVWEYINAWRRDLGTLPVLWDDRLGEASQAHAASMERNRYLAHASQFTGSSLCRARAAGWEMFDMGFGLTGQVVNDIITTEAITPAASVRGLATSPGHRAIVLVYNPISTFIETGEATLNIVGAAVGRLCIRADGSGTVYRGPVSLHKVGGVRINQYTRICDFYWIVDSRGLNQPIFEELGILPCDC